MERPQKLFKQEITPIATNDCFVVFERTKTHFDFPIHYHNEYELNCIKNGDGLTRVVGNHTDETHDWELLLTGPNLIHGWVHSDPLPNTVYEKTLQFHSDLFNEQLLGKNAFSELNTLFNDSLNGILFSRDTAQKAFPMLKKLANSEGLASYILLQELLLMLLHDKNRSILNTEDNIIDKVDNTLNNKLYKYIQDNYHQTITLEDMADLFHVSPSTFNRMIQKQTGNTFIAFVNDYRLGMVARKLLESNYCVQYIAESCGFKNLSNFNRLFKRTFKLTPKEYKVKYKGTTKVK